MPAIGKLIGVYTVIFWIFLVLAVGANSAKGYCSKRLSGLTDGIADNLVLNLIRCLGCVIIGGAIMLVTGKSFALSVSELLCCAVSGISMTAFQLSWIMSLKKGAYMMVSAFSSASFALPCVWGFALLGEPVSLVRLAAIAIICVAIYFLCLYNNKTKTRLSAAAFTFLFAVSVSQGFNQIFQKQFTLAEGSSTVTAYTFYTFVFASVLTVVLLPFFKSETPHAEICKRLLSKKALLLICMSTVGIFAASFLQASAAKGIDASVMYPVLNGLSVCAGTLMSVFIFGEKPKKESVIGIILVLTALLMNTLGK